MPSLRSHLPVLAVTAVLSVALVACGGGGTTESPTGPDETGGTEPGPVLDFSAIAGEWSGSGVENRGNEFFMAASLDSSARLGEKVGDIEYMPEPGASADCRGHWNAEEADDSTFVVDEQIGGLCPPGTVTLELGADGSLTYRYVPDNGNDDLIANGELTRE